MTYSRPSPAGDSVSAWTLVVLSGGRATRLGGVEKSTLLLDGIPLLDHVIAPVPDDIPIVIVGPEIDPQRDVHFVIEEPRYGGPVAGLAAALDAVRTPLLALLATDMPRAGALTTVMIEALVADRYADASVAIDDSGRRQLMCGAFRMDALRRAIRDGGIPADRSMRSLYEQLNVCEVRLTREQSALLHNIDTDEELNAAQSERP